MVSFENFVKSMPPSLSELKVTPSFCFPFKIPDDPTATRCNYTVLPQLDFDQIKNMKIQSSYFRNWLLDPDSPVSKIMYIVYDFFLSLGWFLFDVYLFCVWL